MRPPERCGGHEAAAIYRSTRWCGCGVAAYRARAGAAAEWPLTAHAQERRRMRRIGFLMGTSETDLNEQSSVAASVQTLERLGWVAGKNIEIEYRWTAGDPRGVQEYAQELV